MKMKSGKPRRLLTLKSALRPLLGRDVLALPRAEGHIVDERISLEPRKPRQGFQLVAEGDVRQGTTGVRSRAEGGVQTRVLY
jgi:hypothetical protein